jgi:tetratricopeptide (TPR) repeat protein
LDILREKLSDRANPIGVLIDNLEPALDENYRFREKLRGYDALLAVLGDRDVFSFTLITSRRSLIAPRAKVHEYSLEGLDITAWRQYFHDCENGADSEALVQMRDAYNGNAKVMDILHGAIKNRFDGNIGAYWNRYKDALLADSELETLISVEMDWLRDNQPDAYKLLCRMGCYRYQDVKTVPFEGLICLLWDVPESRQNWVVDYLSKSSLIEFKGEYYLHPAVRDSAKLRLMHNKIDWEKAHQRSAEFWSKSILIIRSINDVIQALEAYYHYIEISDLTSAGEVLISQKIREKEYINNPVCLGTLLFQYGLLGASVFKAEDIINNISSKTYLYARLHNILGNHYAISGNPRKAITFHHKCLDTSTEINIIFLVCYSLINIGHHYLYLLEPEEAIKSFEKILILLADDTICKSKNIYEYDHPYTRHNYGTYAYMAYAHSLQGDLAEAFRFANLFLNMNITNELGDYDNYYNKAYRLAFLGKAYINLNILDKAVYVLSNAYSIANKYSFPEVIGIVYIWLFWV